MATRDIWAAAAILVKRFGADAAFEAGRRADELLAEGDMEGQREWKLILLAIQELQRAKQNPNARLKAMNLLGLCYSEKNMLDLAVKQFQEAASEMVGMDTLKKEIVYTMGLVYERMGKRDESLKCMKDIYEVDYGYKDVAKRVEESYGS